VSWKVVIGNSKITDFQLTCTCLTAIHTQLNTLLYFLLILFFSKQIDPTIELSRVACFIIFAQKRYKDLRSKIIITLSSEIKQSMAYQSSSSTLAACRQRFVIVLIVTRSPAET